MTSLNPSDSAKRPRPMATDMMDRDAERDAERDPKRPRLGSDASNVTGSIKAPAQIPNQVRDIPQVTPCRNQKNLLISFRLARKAQHDPLLSIMIGYTICTADASTIMMSPDAAIVTRQLFLMYFPIEGLWTCEVLNMQAGRVMMVTVLLLEEAQLSEARRATVLACRIRH
jgi:hypothetical protein